MWARTQTGKRVHNAAAALQQPRAFGIPQAAASG
jgi:hypothetical protein